MDRSIDDRMARKYSYPLWGGVEQGALYPPSAWHSPDLNLFRTSFIHIQVVL